MTSFLQNQNYLENITVTSNGQIYTTPKLNSGTKRLFAAGDVSAPVHFFTRKRLKNKQSTFKNFNEGYYAAVNMLALGVPYHNIYYETFDMYNNNFQVFGHGNPYDSRTVIGDLDSLDFMIFYTEKGTVNKVLASGNRVKDFNTLREAMK